jgi:hypothetical protein
MEILLFILLIGVWAAFVVPAFVNSRREAYVSSREPIRSVTAPPPRATAADVRARVLARRKMALIVLGLTVVATLAGAVLTGSTLLLGATLVADVVLAGYVAMLLTIKQRRQHVPASSRAAYSDDADDVRVVTR